LQQRLFRYTPLENLSSSLILLRSLVLTIFMAENAHSVVMVEIGRVSISTITPKQKKKKKKKKKKTKKKKKKKKKKEVGR